MSLSDQSPSTAPDRTAEQPSARTRRDSCPGTLRTYAAGDGRIARIRLAGAPLTADRARGLADLADTLGDGSLGFTTRSNIQVRGLSEDGAIAFASGVERLGLLPSPEHDRARNLVVAPFAGDALLAVAAAYDEQLRARPALASLSGRFLVGLDDGSGEILPLPLDISAQSRDGRLRVALGTDPRGYDAGPLSDPARLGAALADLAEAFAPLAQDEQAWNVDDLSPEAHEELHAVVEGMLPATGNLTAVRRQPQLAGPLRSPDGREWLGATAPLATISSTGWRVLADVAEAAGSGIRVTPWHAMVVPAENVEDTDAVLARLAAAGWVVSADSPWLSVHGCSGIDHCRRSLSDVQEHVRALAAFGPTAKPVMVVGCARRCGHPSVEHLAVVATGPDAYTLAEHDGTHRPQPAPFATASPQALADVIARTYPVDEASDDDAGESVDRGSEQDRS